MRTAALLLVAPAVHAFVAPSTTAPTARLAPLHIAPITVAELDDAVTAKVISAELREMLDREWIEQDCHVVIGQNAADAYLGARAKGLDDVGSKLAVPPQFKTAAEWLNATTPDFMKERLELFGVERARIVEKANVEAGKREIDAHGHGPPHGLLHARRAAGRRARLARDPVLVVRPAPVHRHVAA